MLQSSIFLFFYWDFANRHYFYDKRTVIGFFKSSPSARFYLELLMTISRLNSRAACIDSLLFYISFCFLHSSVFSRKKWLSYLSHAISPYLHRKLINSTSAFHLSFFCTVLPRILSILIFMNRVNSVICICLNWYFYQFWQPADVLFN